MFSFFKSLFKKKKDFIEQQIEKAKITIHNAKQGSVDITALKQIIENSETPDAWYGLSEIGITREEIDSFIEEKQKRIDAVAKWFGFWKKGYVEKHNAENVIKHHIEKVSITRDDIDPTVRDHWFFNPFFQKETPFQKIRALLT